MANFEFLAKASGMTLIIAICALFLGLFLAIVFTMFELSRFRLLRWPATLLVTTLRGLPEILVVFFLYFGSFYILAKNNMDHIRLPFSSISIDLYTITPFVSASLALALIYAAYASQTLRGALQAIPKGQWESGFALGLTRAEIFFRLILPQMWRHALPGLGNQWLVLLKDTALVSLVGMNDLMFQSKAIAIRTHQMFTWYLVAAMIYLVITLLSQRLIQYLQIRLTRFEQNQQENI